MITGYIVAAMVAAAAITRTCHRPPEGRANALVCVPVRPGKG